MNKGARLNIEDIDGNKPLWTAVFNDKGRIDRFEMFKLFLEHGADVNPSVTIKKEGRVSFGTTSEIHQTANDRNNPDTVWIIQDSKTK